MLEEPIVNRSRMLVSHLVRPDVFADLDRLAAEFASAHPFPHLVIDDFLRADAAQAIHDEARVTVTNVNASNDITQRQKVACTQWDAFGPRTNQLIAYFNSSSFIGPLERIAAIEGLFGDPWLEGGGIHLTSRGGFLKMHTDFNWNKKLRADRRINILYYLNKEWQEFFGGHLVIARVGDESNVKRIAPLFNRLVIFNTNDSTLHGHPEPLAFPSDYPRTSIAMYYYSVGRPAHERRRPRSTTTRYIPRHKGDIDIGSGTLRSKLGYLVRRFTRL